MSPAVPLCVGMHLCRGTLCDPVGWLLHRVCHLRAVWAAVVLCVEESVCEAAETRPESLEVPTGKQGVNRIV